MQAAEERAREAEQCAEKMREEKDKFASTVASFERGATDLLDEMRRALEGWEKEAEESLAEYHKSIDAALTSLEEHQSQWQSGEEERFESFRDQHQAELERVTKAYERMRATYDSMKVTVESIEAELEEVSRNLGKQLDEKLNSHRQKTGKELIRLAQELTSRIQKVNGRTTQVFQSWKKEIGTLSDWIAKLEDGMGSFRRGQWVLHAITWAVLLVFIVVMIAGWVVGG